MEVGGECVWDYAGDNYVHRLIQNAADGKAVEYQRNEGGEMSKVRQMKFTLSAHAKCHHDQNQLRL